MLEPLATSGKSGRNIVFKLSFLVIELPDFQNNFFIVFVEILFFPQKELANLKVIELKVCQLETDVFRMNSTFDQVLKHSFDFFLQTKKYKMLSLSF